MELREKIAREIGFSGRDRNDMSETADEFWRHSGGEYREKFYRQSDAILELLKGAVKQDAVNALEHYQQADMDGIMVLVSRQAIEECLPVLRILAALGVK